MFWQVGRMLPPINAYIFQNTQYIRGVHELGQPKKKTQKQKGWVGVNEWVWFLKLENP